MEFRRFWQPGMTMAQAERLIIEHEYKRHGGNREKTAKSLGLAPRTISNKIKSYKKQDENLADKATPTKKREQALKDGYAKQKAASR